MSWKIQVGDQWFNSGRDFVATVVSVRDGFIAYKWESIREAKWSPQNPSTIAITSATEENFNKWGWSRLTDLTKALL